MSGVQVEDVAVARGLDLNARSCGKAVEPIR